MRAILAGLFCLGACAAPGPPEADEAPVTASLDNAPSDPETVLESAPTMPESPPEPERPAEDGPHPEDRIYRVTPDGIAGLPNSDGKTFTDLDTYLAHLEIKGHSDHPFWERMKDGRYRWNTGRAMQFSDPKYATREDLMKRYGFEK